MIEYNARFGDPETQVVLPLLETDLLDIMEAVIDERLESQSITWKKGCAACVVMASGGYPGSYPKGIVIEGLDKDGQAPSGVRTGRPRRHLSWKTEPLSPLADGYWASQP